MTKGFIWTSVGFVVVISTAQVQYRVYGLIVAPKSSRLLYVMNMYQNDQLSGP